MNKSNTNRGYDQAMKRVIDRAFLGKDYGLSAADLNLIHSITAPDVKEAIRPIIEQMEAIRGSDTEAMDLVDLLDHARDTEAKMLHDHYSDLIEKLSDEGKRTVRKTINTELENIVVRETDFRRLAQEHPEVIKEWLRSSISVFNGVNPYTGQAIVPKHETGEMNLNSTNTKFDDGEG